MKNKNHSRQPQQIKFDNKNRMLHSFFNIFTRSTDSTAGLCRAGFYRLQCRIGLSKDPETQAIKSNLSLKLIKNKFL